MKKIASFLLSLFVSLNLCADPIASPVVVSQGALNKELGEALLTLTPLDPRLLAPGYKQIKKNDGFTIHSFIPLNANQKWRIECYDVSKKLDVDAHYHKIQNQTLVVLEGQLHVFQGNAEPLILTAGQIATIPTGLIHNQNPYGGAVRLLVIDTPAYQFPEDVYEMKSMDQKVERVISTTNTFVDTYTKYPKKLLKELEIPKALPSDTYASSTSLGTFTAYSLLPPAATQGRYSMALLDIHDSPRHFHKLTTEEFFVLNGELSLEIDGQTHLLKVGQWARIPPNAIHHLKSAFPNSPVRVLCISFPGHNPNDFHKVCDDCKKAK